LLRHGLLATGSRRADRQTFAHGRCRRGRQVRDASGELVRVAPARGQIECVDIIRNRLARQAKFEAVGRS
jgi:hypothetical protein